MPRYLFAPNNGAGLGHLARLRAIALSLRELEPAAELVFLLDGDDHGLLSAREIRHVKRPLLPKQTDPSWLCDGLLAGFNRQLLEHLRPDVVVFDLLPEQDLLGAAKHLGARIVIVLREVSEDGEHWLEERGVLDDYRQADLILCPHDEAPAFFGDRAIGVGRVAAPLDVRQRDGLPSRYVLVTGGGGGFPGTAAFYNLALRAVALARQEDAQLACILVVGPLFSEWGLLELVTPVTLFRRTSEMQGLMHHARVVVAQAGYNTVEELRMVGASAVLVPGLRGIDNQFARASAAAVDSDAITFMPCDWSALPAAMVRQLAAEILARCAGDPVRGMPTARPAGADRAASAIAELAAIAR